MAVSEVSVVMDMVASRRGCTNRVALEMASFTWLTAVIISRVMVKSFLALERESVKGRTMWGEAGKEPVIKIHHVEESLDVELGGGEGELLDGGDLLREGADPLGVHRVTQEGHGGLG